MVPLSAANTFGKRVRYFRLLKGWSACDLADRLGVARNTVTQMESGNHTPNAARVQALCKVLGICASRLFPAEWNPRQRRTKRLKIGAV